MIAEAIWRICSGIPSWMLSPPTSILFSSSFAWVRRVSMKPKATALTLILNWPHSLATVLVRPITPAFPAVFLGGLAQVRRRRADDPERDHRVDVEHRLEVLVGELVDRAVDRVAGVVDDDVDLAERVHRLLHKLV